MDAGKRPAFQDDHAAPLIQILTWLFLSFSTFSIVAHFATKKAMSRPLTRGDFILLAALILAVGQAVTFLCPAGQAIGNSETSLSKEAIMQAWKALYSGEILSILAIVAAKSSLLIPFMAVTPDPLHQRMMYTTCAVTMLWGLSAVLLIAFQCPAPQRWDITNPRCMDVRAVRTYNAVMNIITDLALAIVPTLMVMPLQLESDRRLTLLVGFWCRISVVIASAVQIGFISTLPSTTTNLLNSIWRIVVCGQVVQVTSIMSSTIPFLKPFLLSLESGFLSAGNVARTTGLGYESAGKSGRLSSYIKIGSGVSKRMERREDESGTGDGNGDGGGGGSIWVRKDVVVSREREGSLELFEIPRKMS